MIRHLSSRDLSDQEFRRKSNFCVKPVYVSHFQPLLIVIVTIIVSIWLIPCLPVLLTCVVIGAPSSPTALGGPGLGHHVAQEMAALCSLAFMRSAAMLEVLRSGSTLRS